MVDDVAIMIEKGKVSMEDHVAIGCGNPSYVEGLIVDHNEKMFGGAEFKEGVDLSHVTKVRATFINVSNYDRIAIIEHQGA